MRDAERQLSTMVPYRLSHLVVNAQGFRFPRAIFRWCYRSTDLLGNFDSFAQSAQHDVILEICSTCRMPCRETRMTR